MNAITANFAFGGNAGSPRGSYLRDWGRHQRTDVDTAFEGRRWAITNFAPKPSAVQLARKRFGTILQLEPGWDGPSSAAISRTATKVAQRILEPALSSVDDPRAPFVVPCADGSLQMEWHTDEVEIELHVGFAGELTLWTHDRISGAEIELEGPTARAAFIRAVSRLGAKSDQHSSAPISEAISA